MNLDYPLVAAFRRWKAIRKLLLQTIAISIAAALLNQPTVQYTNLKQYPLTKRAHTSIKKTTGLNVSALKYTFSANFSQKRTEAKRRQKSTDIAKLNLIFRPIVSHQRQIPQGVLVTLHPEKAKQQTHAISIGYSKRRTPPFSFFFILCKIVRTNQRQ